jgi:hypothetical protein
MPWDVVPEMENTHRILIAGRREFIDDVSY